MKLIACVDQYFNIGYKNNLLFHIPEDMKRFKTLTTGKTVIMGRQTYKSLGKKDGLPDRKNIVISNSNPNFIHHQNFKSSVGWIESMSLNTFLNSHIERIKFMDLCRNSTPNLDDGFYVIGGGKLYDYLLPLCDTLELTIVHQTASESDTAINNLCFDYSPEEVLNSGDLSKYGLTYTVPEDVKYTDPFQFFNSIILVPKKAKVRYELDINETDKNQTGLYDSDSGLYYDFLTYHRVCK